MLAVDVWMWTPFMILIVLAALGSVPKAELEAAEVDGLPWIRRIRHVILPHAKFILMLGMLLRTIDAFKMMDLIYPLTRGGPGNTTEVVGITLYRKAFEGFTMGWSSALAVIAAADRHRLHIDLPLHPQPEPRREEASLMQPTGAGASTTWCCGWSSLVFFLPILWIILAAFKTKDDLLARRR